MLGIARLIFGSTFALVALAMLAVPSTWYSMLPGVAERGAYNAHFVRDIGCAFLVAGLSFIAGGIAPVRWWPAMVAGAAFIALHALVHAAEAIAGIHDHAFVAADLPTVYLPAALGLWLALIGLREQRR